MRIVARLKAAPGRRQRGAVVITFALSLLLLMGFMALVFDLGRTYVVRTELQNAADAAALAGAKDLNQKLAGVTQAIVTVKAMGLQNNTRFSFNGDAGIVITDDMISVSSCPYDGCTWIQASTIASDGQAADKTFLKVDIPSGSLVTFFARVPTTLDGTGIQETRTYGLAVAGYYLKEITPIGICALDPIKGGTRTSAAGTELTEYGFRRGVAYNIMELGPLSGPSMSDPYLLNPVDTWPGPVCDPDHSSANYTAPFICTGVSAAINTVPGNVFGNPGISAGPIEVALNSRFNVNSCAQQDANVKPYAFGDPTFAGSPKSWMEPDPSQQTIGIDPLTRRPFVNPPTFADYGVLWTYNRAVKAVGSSPNATAGDPFELTDWPDLYGGAADSAIYPHTPDGILVEPYNTLSGDYFASPPVTPGKRGRRVLNIAIVNCPGTGTGCNSTIPIVGIGRFFMQVKADLPKRIEAEFGGLVNPIPSFEISLYR